MKKRILVSLVILAVLCSSSVNAVVMGGPIPLMTSQNTPPDNNDINKLKQAIRDLEAAAKDPDFPADITQRHLQERRSELQKLLSDKIDGLKKYLNKFQGSLREDQVSEVQGLIRDYENDLDTLRRVTAGLSNLSNNEPRKSEGQPSAESRTPGTGSATQTTAATVPVANRGPEAQPVASTASQPEAQPNGASTPDSTPQNPPTPAPAQPPTSTVECAQFESNPKTFSLFDKYVCNLTLEVNKRKTDRIDEFGDRVPGNPSAGLNLSQDIFRIATILIARKERPDFILLAEESRVDKQVGSGPSTSGSTSLTVKGSAPTILGLAVENGALVQSVSGTTVTFRGNPLGIYNALANKGFVQSYDESDQSAFTRFLRSLSFSVSFDTSRGNDTSTTDMGGMPAPNIFTADKEQLSAFSLRYEIYNKRDPRHRDYKRDWEIFVDSSSTREFTVAASTMIDALLERIPEGTITIGQKTILITFGTSITGQDTIKTGDNVCLLYKPDARGRISAPSAFAPIDSADPGPGLLRECGVITGFTPAPTELYRFKDPVLQQWYQATQLAVRSASPAQVDSVLRERLNSIPVEGLTSQGSEAIADLSVKLKTYLDARQMILDKIAKGGIVTFEYTNTRQVNAPNLSNFRFVAEKGAGGSFDATANGSLTIFDKIPAGMTKRIRDFQFAGQLDAAFGKAEDVGKIVLSFAGKYQRLLEDAMTPDGMMAMDTKGDIAVGQLKLTVPIKGTGFKIPISVTFANRTELIKEKEVRGNIGITFDLDALFARFKPF